jgi:hypothetical protein
MILEICSMALDKMSGNCKLKELQLDNRVEKR